MKASFLNRRTVLVGAIGVASGAALIGGAAGILSPNAKPVPDQGNVTLYKNPECQCCEGYAGYLRHNGFEVKVIPTNDLTIMGEKYGIPDSLQPCHLSLMAGYVVGGHIPDRGYRPATIGKTADHRHFAPRDAAGHSRHARPKTRPVDDLRDRAATA